MPRTYHDHGLPPGDYADPDHRLGIIRGSAYSTLCRIRHSLETDTPTATLDDIERAAVAADGYHPDDPAVIAALARVREVLAELRKPDPERMDAGVP